MLSQVVFVAKIKLRKIPNISDKVYFECRCQFSLRTIVCAPESSNKSSIPSNANIHTCMFMFQISRFAPVCQKARPGSFPTSADLQQLPAVPRPFHQQRLRGPWTDKALDRYALAGYLVISMRPCAINFCTQLKA